MQMEVSEKEEELIHYFRAVSCFNRERLLVLARTAHEDFERMRKVQACAHSGRS